MAHNPYLGAAFGLPPNPYVAQNVPMPPTMPYPMPNYGQPMKTPEQYKAELLQQMKPQLDQYEGLYKQTQATAQMQANSGQYVKVSSYEEVKQIQTPADGKPVMVFDEVNGRLYSKRFENGQSFIKGFALTPLEDQEEKPQAEPQPDKLDLILGKLDSFDGRISALEGKNDGSVRHDAE